MMTGINNIKSVIDKISKLIKEHIEPALTFFIIEPLEFDNVKVLQLKVFGAEDTPYFYVGDGTRTTYYRLKNQSAPAPANIITELMLKGKKQSYDALDYGKKFADYSFTLFEATYKERTGMAIDHQKDYTSFGMVTGENLTFAGAIFADQYAVYQSRIFCTRWNGLTKTSKFEANDDVEFEGGIIKVLGEALSFIKVNSTVKWHKSEKGRIKYHDYAYDAYFEALVNTLVHRSYTIIGTEIHIDMYDMEIVSPSGMVDGRLIQEISLDQVASARRNPILCDIVHRMHYMERRGSGLNKIVNACPSEAKPEFISTVQSFIVRLKNFNYYMENKAQIDNYEADVLKYLEIHPSATQSAMAYAIGRSRRTVQAVMATLKEKGLIERVGSKKIGA